MNPTLDPASPASDPVSSASTANGMNVYEGIWLVLAKCFRVPRLPPELPQQAGEAIASRRPARNFLTYLRFGFVILMAILILAALIGCAALIVVSPAIGIAVLLLAIALIGAIVVVGWFATRLRYDTTWYVFSDRSMRLRRGIWLIRETTITFENIQNVQTRQGPLQRFFGIADVIVETAGGGSNPHGGSTSGHNGLIEGIENAADLRDAIREKIASSRTSGLGDEADDEHRSACPTRPSGFQPQHVAMLREINQLLQQA